MDDEHRCGPWVDSPEGRVRRCRDGSAELVSTPASITPAFPAVMKAPAIERITITDRTTEIARRLVGLALGSEGSEA